MLENGTVIDGKYEILSKVGQGGMSVVYLAINRKAMKQWAIKEVRRDGVKDFEVVKQSLVAETDMLKKLSHPNLPDIVDIIENDDSFFIVMDYIEGKPLSKRIEESGAQPEEYVIEWAKQLCDVLDYLHTREPAIIYRDMKPSNVMLKPDGSVCLIDFGTAREYKGTNIQDTTCLGTIGYAAPEQFGGRGETDARTDIYCLGATLYHLITGHSPAEPPYEMHPIRYWDDTLSPGLEAIILKCIQKDPNDRYQSCAELKYALENIEENTRVYWDLQKKRYNMFLTSAIATILCLVIGITGSVLGVTNKKSSYESHISAALKSRDAATAKDNFDEAFKQNYVGDSSKDIAYNFIKYIQVIAQNSEDEGINGTTLNEYKSLLGMNDKSNRNTYYSKISSERNKDVYVTFHYYVGYTIISNDASGNSFTEAGKWFKLACDKDIDENELSDKTDIIDRISSDDAPADNISPKNCYKLSKCYSDMIDAQITISSFNESNNFSNDAIGPAYEKIANAVKTVNEADVSDDAVKLTVYDMFLMFFNDDQFKDNLGANANAQKLWADIQAKTQQLAPNTKTLQEIKKRILASNPFSDEGTNQN